MSTQARASLVQPHRLAGATILQLVPDDDAAGGNALTIALLLQRAGARPIIAGRNGPYAEAWRSAGCEWLKLDHDSLNPLKLRRNAARLATFLARERVDIVHAYNAGAAWSARRPRSSRSGSSPTFRTLSPRSAACAESIKRPSRAATM